MPHPLANEAFAAIAQHILAHAEKIGAFAKSQYSFEEWLNWEAFAACCTRTEWRVAPKPRYGNLSIELNGQGYGDLIVTHVQTQQSVWIEIGLAHDGTGDKWLQKLDRDMEKLQCSFPSTITPLQIIVLVSSSPIRNATNWDRWLARMRCWSRANCMDMHGRLPPNGEIVIRGWT